MKALFGRPHSSPSSSTLRPIRLAYAVLAICWFGCGLAGGSLVSDRTHRSGTRLRARLWEADGVSILRDWRDSALNLFCRFARASDGAMRCLPVDSQFVSEYADPNCTAPQVRPGSQLRPEPFVVRVAEQPCPSGHVLEYFELGAERVDPTGFRLEGDRCVAVQNPGYPRVFELVPVDPSRFARATETRESHNELDLSLLVSDDGARQPVDLYDHRRDARCTILHNRSNRVDFDTHCAVNETFGALSSFSSATCSGRAAWGPTHVDGSCREPGFCLFDEARVMACDPNYSVWTLGPATTAYSRGPGGTCTALGPLPGIAIHAALTEIPLTDLPAVRVSTLGLGRLRALIVTPSGTTLPLTPSDLGGAFWDSGLQTRCTPTVFADGMTRCVPDQVRGSYASTFADALCTQRLAVRGPCDTLGIVTDLENADGTIGTAQAVYRIGERFVGAQTYIRSNGACVPTPNPPSELWRTAERIDSTLVPLTERTE